MQKLLPLGKPSRILFDWLCFINMAAYTWMRRLLLWKTLIGSLTLPNFQVSTSLIGMEKFPRCLCFGIQMLEDF